MGIWTGILICFLVWGFLARNLIVIAIREKRGQHAPKYSDRVLKEMQELGIEPWDDEE
ncbi:MAG: hypothetical protein HPY66_0603 [Firmicutes bacterium]|nr:hypothetical protein [Bacillota bacterium]